MPNTLDFNRMFFGDTPPIFLVEIAIRTTILFTYTLFIMRILGQRGLGQLSVTELTLIIALGSAVGDPLMYADVPLFHGMLVVTLIMFYQIALNRLTMRSRKIARLIDGEAIRLVVDGKLDEAGIRAARLTHDEVYAELRQKGIENLSQVHRAYLEQDGKVSIFEADVQRGRGKDIMPEALDT